MIQMKTSTTNKNKYKVYGIILFIFLWQVLAMIVGNDNFILPSFIDTFKEVIKMLSKAYVYKCIFQTLIRMIDGFIIAFVLAFALGSFAGGNEKLELLLSPTMTTLKSIPTASLVYLFLIIVGAKLTPMLIVVLIALPILYEGIVNGVRNTPRDCLDASKLDGCNNMDIIFKIRVPLAKPYIYTGISSSFGLSLKIEIMAEVITGYTRLGLGSAILAAQRSDPLNMVPVFAYSMIAIVLMLIVDEIIRLMSIKIE